MQNFRKPDEDSVFAQWPIPAKSIFYDDGISQGFTNTKPFAEGHVLLKPKRIAKRLSDLNDEEAKSFGLTFCRVGMMLMNHYETPGLFFAIQDGVASGQTVDHVHAHVTPEKARSTEGVDVVEDRGKIKPRSAEDRAIEVDAYLKSVQSIPNIIEGNSECLTSNAGEAEIVLATLGLKVPHIFYESENFMAVPSPSPIAAGHVILTARRCVTRIRDLTNSEMSQIMVDARNVGSMMLRRFDDSDSLFFSIKDDGTNSSNIQVQILPRYKDKYPVLEEIYDALAKTDFERLSPERLEGETAAFRKVATK